MINYVYKGPSLDEHILKSGHWAININGVWHTSDEAAVQALIDGYTIGQTQDWVCRQIDDHARMLRDKVVVGVSAAELASWTIKQSEAAAFQATGLATSAPTLGQEAQARGVSLAAIVARVAQNAPVFLSLEATIAGTAGRHYENPVLEFDFSGELSSIDTAVITVSPAGLLLDGAYQVSGAVVLQRVRSLTGQDKTNYRIRCEAVSGVEKRVRVGVLPVRSE